MSATFWWSGTLRFWVLTWMELSSILGMFWWSSWCPSSSLNMGTIMKSSMLTKFTWGAVYISCFSWNNWREIKLIRKLYECMIKMKIYCLGYCTLNIDWYCIFQLFCVFSYKQFQSCKFTSSLTKYIAWNLHAQYFVIRLNLICHSFNWEI